MGDTRTKYLTTRSGQHIRLMSCGDSDCSQGQIKQFRRWLRDNGFVQSNKHQRESRKRWCQYEGTGRWLGFTVQVMNRVTLPKEYIRQRKDGSIKIVEDNHRGHSWRDDSIIVDAHISCFYRSQNLNGNNRIHWQDLMLAEDPAKLLRTNPRISWEIGWRDRDGVYRAA